MCILLTVVARSSFYGTNHDPLHEILLDKRVDAQHRHGGHDDDAVLQGLGQAHPGFSGGCVQALHVVQGHLVGHQYVAQEGLQRHVLLFVDVDQRGVEIIPVAHRIVQRDDRYDRLG